MEGVGDPGANETRRTDVRGVLAGVLIALLVASLAMPVGGDIVTGGVARRLTLPAEPETSPGSPQPGAFLIAAVEVRPQTLAQWVWAHTLGSGRLLSFGPARLEAATSTPFKKSVDPTAINAWATAVREVGPVLEVTAVQPRSVADRAGLEVGDAVVTINGLRPDVHTLDGNLATGATSRLRVYRAGHVVDLDLKPAAPWPQAPGGGAAFVRRAITAPAPQLSVGKVTGGSAGLVFALAYIDMLTVGDLTGHRLIAATGALGPGGSVDPVLGYDAKVTAAARAGANVFMMPRPDIAAAQPYAPPSVRVVGVSSVEEAVQWLCRNGGVSSVCQP
ncbi:MAG TPA: PDZ domain-containing protein [Acidimicrobiales bacterium]|nr:PDZ domain-containing protein [Acidimicrobiales bacterium]